MTNDFIILFKDLMQKYTCPIFFTSEFLRQSSSIEEYELKNLMHLIERVVDCLPLMTYGLKLEKLEF